MSEVSGQTDSLHRVLAIWTPGSGPWSWAQEFADIIARDGSAIANLLRDVAEHGIREPVLLGDDQRVWDGHHRLLVARILDLPLVPVEHGHDAPSMSQNLAAAHIAQHLEAGDLIRAAHAAEVAELRGPAAAQEETR